jgi:hypothetical protein
VQCDLRRSPYCQLRCSATTRTKRLQDIAWSSELPRCELHEITSDSIFYWARLPTINETECRPLHLKSEIMKKSGGLRRDCLFHGPPSTVMHAPTVHIIQSQMTSALATSHLTQTIAMPSDPERALETDDSTIEEDYQAITRASVLSSELNPRHRSQPTTTQLPIQKLLPRKTAHSPTSPAPPPTFISSPLLSPHHPPHLPHNNEPRSQIQPHHHHHHHTNHLTRRQRRRQGKASLTPSLARHRDSGRGLREWHQLTYQPFTLHRAPAATPDASHSSARQP